MRMPETAKPSRTLIKSRCMLPAGPSNSPWPRLPEDPEAAPSVDSLCHERSTNCWSRSAKYSSVLRIPFRSAASANSSDRRGFDPALGGGAGAAVPDEQERDVIGLGSAAAKFADGVKHGVLHRRQARACAAGQQLAQAVEAEGLFAEVHRLAHAVAKQDQGIAIAQGLGFQHVVGFANEAQGKRAFGEQVHGLAAADQHRRGVAGIDEIEPPAGVQDAEEHGGVLAQFGVIAEKAVDV